MVVLGLSVGVTSSAALMVDGRIAACASEERYNRIKNFDAWPYHAINDCLAIAGVAPGDVDVVAWGSESDPAAEAFLTHRYCRFGVGDFIREQEAYWHPRLYEDRDVDFLELFADKLDLEQYPGREHLEPIRRAKTPALRRHMLGELLARLPEMQLGNGPVQSVRLNHHACHAAYALNALPREGRSALVLTLDGMGDGENATVWLCGNGAMSKLYGTDDFLAGRYYRHTTLLLGMKMVEDEYKVMGLAPYAKPHHYRKPYEAFAEALQVRGTEVGFGERPRDAYFHFKERLKDARFDGVAAGLQRHLEDLVTEWFSAWMTRTGIRDVCYSGGVAMNVRANQAVAERCGPESFLVPGSGGDESLAIGACYRYAMDKGLDVEPLGDLYLGPAVGREDGLAAARKLAGNGRYQVVEEAGPDAVAEKLAEGLILGRCTGRMEFGARALGNRSILVDPRERAATRRLNDKVKGRDFWMPFAPSVLAERGPDYLELYDGTDYSCMSVGAATTPAGRGALPAALHPADDTARPQLVKEEVAPGYHALIRAFERRTGVGALLNTSLNIHGYPIVRDAEDAVQVLEETDIDGMVIGGTLILKTRPDNGA